MRLDAGTLFGHVPRTLYRRWIEEDASGHVGLANRSLLVEDGAHRVLLETGVGAFFSPSLRERYGVESGQHELLGSLAARNLADSDIDWVVLSHLHFDHAGGLLAPHEDDREPRLLFPKARFLVSRAAWDRARRPHTRDRASFIDALPKLLEKSGRLVIVDDPSAATRLLGERYQFRITEGHTPGMLHATVMGARARLFFGADLIPGRAWVHLPITMGYDRHAEQVVDEKEQLYLAHDRETLVVFFTHDPLCAAATVELRDGRFQSGPPILDFDGWELDQTEHPT